mgnify:CR=1 FL=1
MCMMCGPLLKAIDAYLQKADNDLADELEEEGYVQPKKTLKYLDDMEEQVAAALLAETDYILEAAKGAVDLEAFAADVWPGVKLSDELMKTLQEQMKAANRAIRLKDTEAGDDLLREMGYSEEAIKELRKPDYCGRVGYPNYALSNNNANIHRVEERIKKLKTIKERGSSEVEYKTFKVVENTEAMRYQIIFDGKPEPEVRDLLKSNGFKWAPSQGAWQRQITSNGRYALGKVVEKLKEMEEAEQQ